MENAHSATTENVLNNLTEEEVKKLAALRQDIQDGLDSGGSAPLDFEALRTFVLGLSAQSAQ